MTKRSGTILGLLLGIVVVEILILSPGELGKKAEVVTQAGMGPPLNPDTPHLGQVMSDFYLVLSEGERKEGELWGKQASRPNDSASWTIDQVKVKFFAENGVTYLVTGDKGYVVTNVNDVRITGHVITRASNGYVFKGDSVFYNSTERRLSSPHEVEMIGPKDEEGNALNLTGYDMLADMKTNQIDIRQNVHARKTIRDGKVATITSEHAKLSGQNKQALFTENVVIDVETLRITGPQATFTYKSGTDAIESVLVNGGVKVTDMDKWATSEQVRVHFDNDKFVFNGAPRVVQNGDELRGDEITFLDGGRKVEVSNARASIDPRTLQNPTQNSLQSPGQNPTPNSTKKN